MADGRRAGLMHFSGVAGYRRLRQIDPDAAQIIIQFTERLAVKHNLEPAVATDIKQALCQIALDIATRAATTTVMG